MPPDDILILELHEGVTLELLRVSAGDFMMGTNSMLNDWFEHARPVHSVTIERDFYLGKYEVTQSQWETVMGNNPSNSATSGDQPVEQVSWAEAVEFCERVSDLTGQEVRLPSEAEWEYACRAGTTTDYSFGNSSSALGEYAWYEANSEFTTHPVGEKLPNPWGLHDLHGNVWEWCQDVWHEDYSGAPTDGTAWTTDGDSARRIIRGGSRANLPSVLLSGNRHSQESEAPHFLIGFRVASGT
jgi:formylglycine-generating enzyme required for sulfatase activity